MKEKLNAWLTGNGKDLVRAWKIVNVCKSDVAPAYKREDKCLRSLQLAFGLARSIRHFVAELWRPHGMSIPLPAQIEKK